MESSRITTSFLCSTRRFAFSMTISATCTCRAAGSSNVLETTSPFTVRCISVTSSGRSSISNTMRMTSGWFAVMAVAIFCRSIVLPAFAGGGDQINRARGQVLGRAVAAFELQALGRMERRQVLKQHLVARAVRRIKIDLADLQEREVALAVL